jgi:DNA modification methylase
MARRSDSRGRMLRGNGYAISRCLDPKLVGIETLKPLGRKTRKHPAAQVRKLAASLEEFGFVLPVVIDGSGRVVGGWGLVLAALRLGLKEVPAVTIADLDDAKLRVLRLALNRLAEDSRWDPTEIALEFADLLQIDSTIDLEISGFEMGEIDVLLAPDGADEEDEWPAPDDGSTLMSEPGDLWLLGEHRVLCGNAIDPASFEQLLGGETVQMVFTDPPWNIPIEGNVSGLGAVRHRDFAMAAGEMTPVQYQDFLEVSLGLAARYSQDGSIHYICMHWTKLEELLAATKGIYSELKALCVWNKTNAGMGSLYRSKHELIFAFKRGREPHINNIEMGRFGRHRSNVWDYAGQNVLHGTSKSKLLLHPTVKPVSLVMDAILDCSNRDGIILDPFGGAGTTLIAAEKASRKARLIEIDSRYVDVIIKRWQHLTGRTAIKSEAKTRTAQCETAEGGQIASGLGNL